MIDHPDIDGRFIKSVEHGMKLSLRMMFEKLYADITFKNEYSDISLRSLVIYEGIKGNYVFKYEKDEIVPQYIRH